MKARNVSKGDWITVGGKPVKVTSAERTMRRGRHVVKVSYAAGTRSGMLIREPDAQVAHLAGERGKGP